MRNNYKIFPAKSIILSLMLMTQAFTSSYAEPVFTPTSTLDKYYKIMHPYVSLSGGYGTFAALAAGTGQTSFARLGLGAQWDLTPTQMIGAEIGIQSAKRMQLTSESVAPFYQDYPYPLPIFLTESPPIDLLVSFKYHFQSPLFVQAKAGTVYTRLMMDGNDISNANGTTLSLGML